MWFFCFMLFLSARSQWEQVPGFTGGTAYAFVRCSDTAQLLGTSLGVNILSNSTMPDWENYVTPDYPVVTGLAMFHDSLIIGTPGGLYINGLQDKMLHDFSMNLPGTHVLNLYEFRLNGVSCLTLILRDHGIFYFDPGCRQWISWNMDLENLNIHDLIQGDSMGDATLRESFWLANDDGIFKSKGLGSQWEPVAEIPNAGSTLSLVSFFTWEHTLFAGTDSGLYQLKDTSDAWSLIPEVPALSITALYKKRDQNLFFWVVAGTSESETWFYDPVDFTWDHYPLSITDAPPIRAFRCDGQHLLALTDYYGIFHIDVFYEWNATNDGLFQIDTRCMIDYDGNDHFVLVGTHGNGIRRKYSYGDPVPFNEGLASPDIDLLFDAGPYLVTSAGGRMYYLDESLLEWVDFAYSGWDETPCIGISYTNTSTAMVVAKENGIRYNNFMYDTTWYPLNQGIEGCGISSLVTWHDTMYISTYDSGVYWFNDYDSTWQQKTTEGLGANAINSMEVCNGVIYAGTFYGIFALYPDSTYWVPVNEGLTNFNNITLKAHNDMLFASFYPNNFCVANTTTMQWRDRSEDFPEYTFIKDIYIDEPYVYLSSNRSLWRRDLGEMHQGIHEEKKATTLMCFPNPCHGILFIDASKVPGNIMTLVLFDLQGRTIQVKQTEKSLNGIHSIDINNLTPGLYFVSMQTRKGSYSAKILKQ